MNWLREELKKFRKNGQFDLSAGESSSVYFDLKEAFGNPELLSCIVNNLYGLVGIKPNFVAGRGYGGITLATAVSLRKGINLTLVRNSQKDYGTKKTIECYTPVKGDVGIIVDDVSTTGNSLRKTAEIIKTTGARISGFYVVVNRGKNSFNLPLHHLYTLDDLM